MNDVQIITGIAIFFGMVIVVSILSRIKATRKKKRIKERVAAAQQKIDARALPPGALHDPWGGNPQEDKYFIKSTKKIQHEGIPYEP